MNTMNFCGSVESLQSKRTSLQGSPCRPVGRELTDELAATLSAHLPPKPRARGSPRSGSSGAGRARLLAFAGRAKRPSGGSLNERHPPIDCDTDAAKPSANSRPNATSKPAAISIATGSKRETSDEISGRQTLYRHCRPQDQRQPRGCILEGAQRDCQRTRPDFVRLGG